MCRIFALGLGKIGKISQIHKVKFPLRVKIGNVAGPSHARIAQATERPYATAAVNSERQQAFKCFCEQKG